MIDHLIQNFAANQRSVFTIVPHIAPSFTANQRPMCILHYTWPIRHLFFFIHGYSFDWLTDWQSEALHKKKNICNIWIFCWWVTDGQTLSIFTPKIKTRCLGPAEVHWIRRSSTSGVRQEYYLYMLMNCTFLWLIELCC